MKTAIGPFNVIWIMGDKEVTKEEVIEYIKQRRTASRKEREQLEHQNRDMGRPSNTVRMA